MDKLTQGQMSISFENRYHCKDGSWRRFSWRAIPFLDEQRIYAAAQDITELREAEEALRTSENNLDSTLRSIGDGVLCTDNNSRITRLNPVAEALTGWRQAEALGRPVEDIFRIINEETRESALIPVADTLAKGTIHGPP